MRQRKQFAWLRPYLDCGYTMERGRGGHFKIRDPEGRYAVSLSCTPSDPNGMKMAERALRRYHRDRSMPEVRAG